MADTITAISTAPGEAGIGIVRTSGPASIYIMKKLMANCPATIEPRHAYLGRVVYNSDDPDSDIIDQAIFLYMKSPRSYTGEDMLEIQAHGSSASLRNIIRAVLSCGSTNRDTNRTGSSAINTKPGTGTVVNTYTTAAEGSDTNVRPNTTDCENAYAGTIRMAEPGEFTKLAFLNGKMDLSQAEAVIDIIKAKTDLTLGIAESQQEGRLGGSIRTMRAELLDTLARMAVDIDYPDEDEENVGTNSAAGLARELMQVRSETEALLETAAVGRIAREGARAVIIGKPNAGKSSLMNAILGEGRVIVTDVPGTTRDTVEETASLGGVPIVLVDTAGLRETDDKVERIGIEKTEQAIASADLVILVLDGSRDLDAEDNRVLACLENADMRYLLVVINKDDLGNTLTEDDVQKLFPGASAIKTSLIGGAANDAARRISEKVAEMHGLVDLNVREMNIVTNERHAAMLRSARENLSDAISMLELGEPMEVAELSAHYAYNDLGAIIGEEAGEEVIDTIFSKFCLGK